MANKTVKAFAALLCADGAEPDSCTGYTRVYIGEIYDHQLDQIPMMDQIVFPDVLKPGYRPVSAFAVYDRQKDGMQMKVWQLPESVCVNAGEIPVMHHGKLLRGVEIQAQIISQSVDGMWFT